MNTQSTLGLLGIIFACANCGGIQADPSGDGGGATGTDAGSAGKHALAGAGGARNSSGGASSSTGGTPNAQGGETSSSGGKQAASGGTGTTGGAGGRAAGGAGNAGSSNCAPDEWQCCNYDTHEWTMPLCYTQGKSRITSCPEGTGSLSDPKGTCPPAGICQCTATQYCDSPSNTCSMLGTCVERPTVCSADASPVCACDSKVYANECEARKAGVDIALSCVTVPSGYQACGSKLCKLDSQYCRMQPKSGTAIWDYSCLPLPSPCGVGKKSCSCLSGENCGNTCSEVGGGLSLLCPAQ